ncbi:MAG: DUF4139 domain-containing protein [Opitutales bacterium]
MKTKPLFPTVWISLAALTMASAADSHIQRVEIFSSGAAVTRSVILEPGNENSRSVRVEGLPSSLLDSSIRISPEEGNPLQIGGFRFLPRENPVKPDDPRTQDLRERVDNLDTLLREGREEEELIKERISHYEGLASALKESLKEKAETDAYELALKAWASLEEIRKEGQARLAGLAKEQEKLRIEQEEAQKDLQDKVAQLEKTAGVIEFEVSGNLARGSRLALGYQVEQAGWKPVYEIRALPAEKSLKWVYKARIRQRSGEDWKDVAVSLKSTSALYAGDLPDLPPLILRNAQEKGYSVSPRSVKQAPDAAMMEAPPEEEIAAPESTTTSFYIELPQRLSLISGKEPVIREAFADTLEAEFWSQAVPELSTEAWLMAGTTNDLGWPILRGEAYAYIDNELVARKSLEGYGAGEEIELALGKNEKIAIERKERTRKESEGGLIDRSKRHEIKYETTVANNMAVGHRVVLKDRFPVGRDNKIQVRQMSPKKVEVEEGTGIFEWEADIAPGNSANLVTEYMVTYPAEWTLYPPL